jgi:hypothetical protein
MVRKNNKTVEFESPKEEELPEEELPEEEEVSDDKKSSSEDRTFKIIVESIKPEEDTPKPKPKLLESDGGKYVGKNPMQAAKKAFNRICRLADCDCYCKDSCSCDKTVCKCAGKKGCTCTYKNSCIYIFSIQEFTFDSFNKISFNKIFSYRGERTRLDKPQKVPRKDIEYFVNYISHVKSYKVCNSQNKPCIEKKTVGRPSKNKKEAVDEKPEVSKDEPSSSTNETESAPLAAAPKKVAVKKVAVKKVAVKKNSK